MIESNFRNCQQGKKNIFIVEHKKKKFEDEEISEFEENANLTMYINDVVVVRRDGERIRQKKM